MMGRKKKIQTPEPEIEESEPEPESEEKDEKKERKILILKIEKYTINRTSHGYIFMKDGNQSGAKYPSTLDHSLKLMSESLLLESIENTENYSGSISDFRHALSEHFERFKILTEGL